MSKHSFFLIFSLMIILIPSHLQSQEKKKRPKRPPSPVVVQPVKVELHNPQIQLTGTLRPFKKVFLSVDDSGRIKEIFKREGDFVKEGELLAQAVNPSREGNLELAKIALKQSIIQMNLAQTQLKRTELLNKRRVKTGEQLDVDEAQYRVQQSNVEAKKAEIKRLQSLVSSYSIKAPFDGQILSHSIELGKWITPSVVLYQVVNYEVLELKLGVPGKYLGQIPTDSPVMVQLKESGNKLEGKIKSVIHNVEESTGNFLIIIHVPNSNGLALSGLFVQASIPLGIPKEKMFVPRDAIVRRGNRTHVIVIRGGVAQIEPVQVEGSQKDLVTVIAKTLKAGEQVVVRGNERLFSGTTVKINQDIPIN